MSKQKLKLLILLNLTWTVLGIFADLEWLSMIPHYLIPLTAICSLYPLLLLIWYILKYYDRKIPNWYTFWLVLGTASYGILAQFYFPFLMAWKGINFHDVGSMFWVAVYGFQSLILIRHLKIPSLLTLLPGVIYILAADFTHYFGKTFVDFDIPNYPLWMKNTTGIAALVIQFGTAAVIYRYVKTSKTPTLNQPV